MQPSGPPPQGPYQRYAPPEPPVKKTNTTLWIVLGVVGGVGACGCIVLAAILFPVFGQAKVAAKEAAKKVACLSNTKQQALGLIMYSTDHDDRFPGAKGWMDSVMEYTKNEAVYHCPSVEGSPNYGYALSRKLAGKKTVDIPNPRTEILVFESTLAGRSAVGGRETMPSPGRHRGNNNAAFADGRAQSGVR